jgi:large subunit ribosomal protein L21
MLAVIKTGGKQYLVKEGDKLKVEKLANEAGKTLTFSEVLLLSDEKGDTVKVGNPFLEKAKVEAKVLKQAKDKKITILKHRAKKRYKVKKGYRQPFSEIEITKITSA